MKRRVGIVLAAMALAFPSAAMGGSVNLDRSTGTSGAKVTVSGQGYAPLTVGSVGFAGQPSTDVFTASDGAFSTALTIPGTAGATNVIVRVPENVPFTIAYNLAAPVLSVDADGKTLRWSVDTPTPDISKFEIWRDGTTWVTQLGADVRSYTPTLPNDGQPHTFRVVAYNYSTGTGSYKNSNTVTVQQAAPPATEFNTLAFSDDFDGTALNTANWQVYTTPGNHAAEPGIRSASAIAVRDGKLVITATNNSAGEVVTGGLSHRINYKYGRFEARVRTDTDPTATMSGVILTWPQSGNWPIDGENDFYETLHNTSRFPVRSFFHYGADNRTENLTHNVDGSQWHTFRMDWSANAIRMYVNGAPSGVITNLDAIPDVAHHLCIQFDAFAKRALGAARVMEVDYVRIYT